MTTLYRAGARAGVIGDPISHSLSPTIHKFFLEKYQINGSYEAILVAKENLESEIKRLIGLGFSGFNVTIPHKEAVFSLCHFKSKSAQITKAVNTVVITKNGELFGHNSDADGFWNNLTRQCPNMIKNNAFVIGAGGAARAVIYSLLKAGFASIFITNRAQDKALKLAKDFKKFFPEQQIHILSMHDFSESMGKCNLLVNSSALGMYGFEELSIDLSNLKKEAIVADIVYKPLETKLLQIAKSNGNTAVNGIGMLIEQALVGFELWFKHKAEYSAKLENSLINLAKI